MSKPSGSLVEPLTRRELVILAYLAQDKTNREIAASETLALSSVKWYVQQIYAKLGVNQRSQAVARARQLGLLKSHSSPVAPGKKHNLPAQLTSFIGREKEISALRLLLKKPSTRLVTLTGPGGTGKTRLSLQLAAGMLDDFPEGIWMVELAPLSDPSLVPHTIIKVLGQVEEPGKTSIEFLEDYLQPRRLLLILDNCEHLVESCAALAATLLQHDPHLTILASSREILGADGEIPFRVPPLGMPDPQHLLSLEGLARFEAVRLFIERAQVVSPEFTLTPENAPAVVQITQRLDGIPLAIELAAARLRLLSVSQIASRLNDAFRLLTGGSRTTLPRHQTLQALIDWSYDLLSETERELLRRLSVFAGGWTLEAAEAVGGESDSVLDLLGQLADKSLIQAAPTPDGEMRYHMLETVRQYAHTHLVEAREAEAVRKCHLDYFLHLAERLEPKLRGREQIPVLDYLGIELDNLRLALEWALQTDIQAELRLAASLKWFWHIRYHWVEGIAWLEQGITAESLSRGGQPLAGAQAPVRAKALAALGFHINMRDLPVPTNALPFLEEALALNRASGPQHRQGLGWTLYLLGWSRSLVGDLVQARALEEEALALFRETGDLHGMVESLSVLGDLEVDPARKKKILQEQLAVDDANGDTEGIATDLFFIGETDLNLGDFESAYVAYELSRNDYQLVGNPSMAVICGIRHAICSFYTSNFERASTQLDDALCESREIAHMGRVATGLFWKCMFILSQGFYDQADELFPEIGRIALKTQNPSIVARMQYIRARLARLRGDIAEARRCAEEGIKSDLGSSSEKSMLLLESGHLALREGNLAQAGTFCRAALQQMFFWRDFFWLDALLEVLAVLAVRQDQMERAAHLFGTRLWRGWANALSPIEHTARDADFAIIKSALGEERFAQLQAEGYAMPFMQVLALAQES